MTKHEIVADLAERAGTNNADAERVLNAFVDLVNDQAKSGDELALPGLGKFQVVKRSARTARNPQTGQPIDIPETFAPKFKAAARLKESAKS